MRRRREMFLLVRVTCQTLGAALHPDRVRFVATSAFVVPLGRVRPRPCLVAILTRGQCVGMGFVAPFAARMRTGQTPDARSLRRMTLLASIEPRHRGLVWTVATLTAMPLEQSVRGNRRMAFGTRFGWPWAVPTVATLTLSMRFRPPLTRAAELRRVAG